MASLNNSQLGKESLYPEQYDKSVLFRIDRTENRIRYGIDPENLPFKGVDVWNAYEISFLTDNGLPVSRVMKMKYDAASPYLVESKSLKLYLNSFNMEKCGRSQHDAEKKVKMLIQKNLTDLLETPVEVSFFSDSDQKRFAFQNYQELKQLVPEDSLDAIEFTHFLETPELLHGKRTQTIRNYVFRSDLLRSNCPVTNQPDWGDLFVKMDCRYDVDLRSVVAYLVSFRKENHFHEEVAEMIFKRFTDVFQPASLMVAAMYTRRGGIDINPVRATDESLIEEAFTDMSKRLGKTLRQ
ncbi:MAG: NADPH-dependent 7-cyano-7-deazaguanine reductase QueF [Paludibacter sp.]|nr:NADPH-dependent 7-cyano-7-deazaguanine reductase QueF [Paludibacter sp.]